MGKAIPPRLGLALLAASVAVLLTGVALGDQTCLLDDLALGGRWHVDVWSHAPGSITTVADVPESMKARKSLEVRIDWPRDDEFRYFSVQPEPSRGPIPYRVKEVSLWVRGVGDKHFLELHFKDARGADLKLGFGAADFQGWRKLTQQVPADWAQPLTFASITWHNWGLKGVGGPAVTALARLECALDESKRLLPGEDKPELFVEPEGPSGLADGGGKATVDVAVLSWSNRPRKLALAQELFSAEGKSLKRETPDLDFRGEYGGATAWQLPACGCYRVATTLNDGGKVIAKAGTRVARVAVPLKLTDEERMNSSIGVNTHLGAPWEVFARLGIHWARDYSWSWLGRGETAPMGNGRDYAAVLADARRAGVIILPVLQGAFRNKAETGFLEDSAAISAGFERLSKAFPTVPFWEIDNEYEYALRDKGFNLPDYERALVAAAAGLKRAGKARLVPNGTAGVRTDIAQALLSSTARDAIACINSHCYTGAEPPETGVSDVAIGNGGQVRLTMPDQLRQISRLAHAAGKQSWLTETGWDVTNGRPVGNETRRVSEERQAEYLPRVYLMARACGVDKIFWFYDRDVPGSTTVFSTCGLIRLDGSLRPSGVAMAALSRESARAKVAGTLDFGPDIWAVVLAQPDGTWTVAIWSVAKDHPLPDGFGGAGAVDIFGNRAHPKRVTPSILYFHFAKLPAAWERQMQARWDTPAVLTTSPGGEVEARLTAPGAKVAWAKLPAGVTAAGWHADGAAQVDTLRVDMSAKPGTYAISAEARGEGWKRSFPATLIVEPALTITGSVTYEPDEPEIKTVASAALTGTVTARLVGGEGLVAPDKFEVAPGKPHRIAVVPSASASGPLTLELGLGNGIMQTLTLRPLRLSVAHLPAMSDCPSQGEATLRIGWSAAGLTVSADMPAAFLTEGKPASFWDFTNLEVFVDPAAGEDGWTPSCRQFWMTPVRKDGEWGAACGLWDRLGGKGAVPEPRCHATVALQGDRAVLTATLPAAVLGKAPKQGEVWRVAISAQGVSPGGTIEVGWPRPKDDGILKGPGSWGVATFE